MSNPRPQNNDDEEDPDILELRAMALNSLNSKEKKKVENIPQNHSHPQHQQQPSTYVPYHHDRHRLNHLPHLNGGSHYSGMRPDFQRNHFSPMDQHQRMMASPFVPHVPPFLSGHPSMIQPHLNPNFVAQPGAPIHREYSMPLEEDMPALPLQESSSFEPTPPPRLSPRSAMFVAQNKEALRRLTQRRRSSSSDRSRSRSPYKYRPRSRSPHQKLQHIARKRTRSKSANKDNGYVSKFTRKSRSPRRRSQEKRISPNNKRQGGFRYNGNRDRRGRENNERDRKFNRISPKNGEDKKESDAEKKIEAKRSSKSPEKREKTEQEIEDELLASSDSEISTKEVEPEEGDELKLTADDNDLDFLDDDEEESENEGRFKSKASSSQPKKQAAGSFKSSFPGKNFDRRDKNYSRHDYKRSKYDEPRRERRNSRSRSPLKRKSPEVRRKSPEVRKKTPEVRRKTPEAKKKTPEVRKKSPEVRRKTPEVSRKTIVINKKESKEVKPLFKATFMTVEAPADDKKKDEAPKKEERIRLVRQSAVNRVEPLKSEKTKEVKAEKAIMKRLGGYIKESAPSKNVKAAWAKEQA